MNGSRLDALTEQQEIPERRWCAHLHAWHAPRIVGGGVAEGDVGDEFESELAGIQQLHQGFVLLVGLHGLLYHDSGVEDLL